MRTIVNISLPTNLANDVEKAVQEGLYASRSEFFRDLLRDWKENKILKELRKSQLAIKQGKGHVLKSLKDLR